MSETKEVRDATITGLLAQNNSLKQELHGYRRFLGRIINEGVELLEDSNARHARAREAIDYAGDTSATEHVPMPVGVSRLAGSRDSNA